MEGETLRPFIRKFVNTPGHYDRLIAGTAQKRLAGRAEILYENQKEVFDVHRMKVSKGQCLNIRNDCTSHHIRLFCCSRSISKIMGWLFYIFWVIQGHEPDCGTLTYFNLQFVLIVAKYCEICNHRFVSDNKVMHVLSSTCHLL